MKRLLSLILVLLPSLAYSQGPSSAQIEAAKGIVKLFTTAGLPATCYPGQRIWDTTANATKVCANDGVTWSSISFTGGAITTPILAPAANNCASIPYSFTSDGNTGVCSRLDGAVSVYNDGVEKMLVYFGDTYLGGSLRMSSTLNTSATDVILTPDAANTLALRNGTNAQKFIWNYSYTDGSNYAQGALKTSSTGIEIAAETAGSGADNLDITLTPAGTGKVVLGGTASPAAADACTAGSATWDASYIYICTATGVWKRAALTGGY